MGNTSKIVTAIANSTIVGLVSASICTIMFSCRYDVAHRADLVAFVLRFGLDDGLHEVLDNIENYFTKSFTIDSDVKIIGATEVVLVD
ncbi:MAG: hypothetical protein SFT93_04315 [Rickettsiaceae bacterium]|nr:hypothetical protein [Rickettsiaceae bacterium]